MIDPSERHGLVGSLDLWQMKRAFQIRFLRAIGLRPNHYLLDLGCGTLRGGIPIIEYLEPGHYYGIESRRKALQEGHQELAENGLEDRVPQLLCVEDLRDCDLGRRFDIIWAFAVLIHMTDEILERALMFVSRHLEANGSFYGNVHVGDASQDRGWRSFPVVFRPEAFYERACRDAGLSLRTMGPLRDLGHVSGREGDSSQMLEIRKV